MKKISMAVLTLIIAGLFYMFLPLDSELLSQNAWERKLAEHNFPDIIEQEDEGRFLSYSEFREEVSGDPEDLYDAYKDRYIRFDTAEELYRFSVDVCYHPDVVYQIGEEKLSEEMIGVLLKLNYVLGCDIDYAVMKSKAFIPIGYSFELEEDEHRNVFSGSFDGRGFEIYNLYVADYPYLHVEGEEEEHIVTTAYYAMFTYNAGTIKNLGLINPTYELTEEHQDLSKAANLVGCNEENGVVEYVYVIDDRPGDLHAGIRMQVPYGQTQTTYSAAGIVHDNYGLFHNAYYVSNLVVNSSFVNNFRVQPVLYNNYASSDNVYDLIYDSDVYFMSETSPYEITDPNEYALPESTNKLRSASDLGDDWHYYPADSYPSLQGLRYVNGKYLIEDAVDFIVFAKLLNLNSVQHDRVFRAADYLIVNDLNMHEVSPDAYTTPIVEFSGSLSGLKEDESNAYISFLRIKDGVVIGNDYYCGLFSVLSGRVEHITFYDARISLTNTEAYYSYRFHIGLIAGELRENHTRKGEINHLYLDGEINLGNQALGDAAAGLLVGSASGTVTNVFVQGELEGGVHAFTSEQSVAPVYRLGGIIGEASGRLRLDNALNLGSVAGVGSSSTVTATTDAEVYLGGIIGLVTNPSQSSHFSLLTNRGDLQLRTFSSNRGNRQYIGGIFGMTEGAAYQLDEDFGIWTNEGLLDVNNRGSNAVTASGILNTRHGEQTEFIYLYNRGALDTNNFSNLRYAPLVYDLGTAGVVLSQSDNESDCEIVGDYDFSGVFHSENNAPSLLRFVENRGKITYRNQTPGREINIAGITLSEKVNYQSVFFSGTIEVYNVTTAHSFWISGITKTLTSGYCIKGSINKGEIYFAKINASANSYLAGLVNLNQSGDLQDYSEDATLPKASIGIINSVNYCDLTSTMNADYYGITGSGNVFAGGIVTLNRGSIQDTLNMGDVKFANLSPISSSVRFSDDEWTGGMVEAARYGIIVGGVAAAAAHSNSRIYDSANSGDVIAQSRNFGRAGGVLALCLPYELQAALVDNAYFDDTISNSVLSNCINYGRISSVTENIILYRTSQVTQSIRFYFGSSRAGETFTIYTRTGTNERPGIHSSAGGVIGYGLSVMRRMVNHGEVSSTDVAGGIVGATFAYHPSSNIDTTVVNIDTAINYGRVRAVDRSDYDFDRVDLDYEHIAENFYPVNSEFIYPNTLSDIRKFPEGKRGIGGIFGRLQRARDHYMSSVGGKFTYIVNMDGNVDLIGRLDQVYDYSSSARFFNFAGSECIYYTAKENDTTQAVFTGTYNYSFNSTAQATGMATRERISYQRISGSRYWRIVSREINNPTYTYTGDLYISVGGLNNWIATNVQYEEPGTGGWFEISRTEVSSSGSTQTYNLNPPEMSTGTFTLTTNQTYRMVDAVEVPLIKEDPDAPNGEFVYDENFEMRTRPELQEYIYYVENGILSDRFRPHRLHGMYVLATSSGSTYGSALPSNVDLTKTYPLEGRIPHDIDYDNIPLSYRNQPVDEDDPELEKAILTEYHSLLQTRYNDKSALLTEGQNLAMEEIGGSGTVLLNPTINGNMITFNLSLDTIIPSQSITRYKIISALIPANALIAEKREEYPGTDAEFIQKLREDKYDVISDQVPPDLSIDISDYANITTNTQVFLGNFVSYSEAAVLDTTFLDDYNTEYQVWLNLIPRRDVAPSAYRYSVDGGSLNTFPTSGIIPGTVSSALRVTFRDQSQVLPVGASIENFIALYYGSHTEAVLREYYELTVVPVQDDYYHSFEFTIELSPELRSGTYTIKYRFFASDTERTIQFTKAASTENSILYLEHYSYYDFVPFTGTSFTTLVNFSYPLDLSNIGFAIEEEETEPYLEGRTYKILLGGEESFFTAFRIPAFSELTSVEYLGQTFTGGYITYRIRYVVRSESGAVATYTHSIEEREISLAEAVIYKDNNRVPIDNVFCTREALSTKFAIDFGIDPEYATLIYNLYEDNPDAYFGFQIRLPNGNIVEEAEGIAFSADNFLNIFFLYESLPGEYQFTITYHRGEVVINFPEVLKITKLEGVSAYLKDIRFSTSLLETDYAEILVSDNDGFPIPSGYSPRVYFAGIDYDGAEGQVFNFRINGTVANIPLDEYTPIFLDFLPAGATIARKIYPMDGRPGEWTDEVDINSPAELKAQLAANFTINPYTGEEPGEEEDVIITYRVTSENKQQEVYYHITVTDISYNVTLIFNVYYEVNGEKIPAENTDLLGKVFLINVKNFNTDQEAGTTPINDVDLFPEFNYLNPEYPYNNDVNMFYHVSLADYRIRFGRNMGGFYAISVNLPDSLGDAGLEYRIEFNGKELRDLSEYGIEGKYFYINKSKRYRTRYLDLVISEAESESEGWGLFDWIKSWFS